MQSFGTLVGPAKPGIITFSSMSANQRGRVLAQLFPIPEGPLTWGQTKNPPEFLTLCKYHAEVRGGRTKFNPLQYNALFTQFKMSYNREMNRGSDTYVCAWA